MKKLILAATIAVASTTSIQANASDAILVKLCESIAVDDKRAFRYALSANKLKVRKLYGDVQCNGQSILRFAFSKGANKTGELIAKKLNKKILSQPESDGKVVVDWATENGFGDSPIIGAINKRIAG